MSAVVEVPDPQDELIELAIDILPSDYDLIRFDEIITKIYTEQIKTEDELRAFILAISAADIELFKKNR